MVLVDFEFIVLAANKIETYSSQFCRILNHRSVV